MGRGTLLIGYDVEHTWGDAQVTERFLHVAVDLHEHLKAPATFYVVGQLAESYARWWLRLAEHPLFDVGQRTYSHRLIKTLCQENDHGVMLALTGFVITSTNSRAIRYPTDQSQT